jgi:3-hydroxybutyrate dehydrogenase
MTQNSAIFSDKGFLVGKTALVTGSTSGIGLGIAISLAKQGARVILNGFTTDDEIKKLLETVGQFNQGQVSYDAADLSKPSEIEELMQRINAQGGTDILVNNAGIQFVASVETLPVEKWDSIIAINLSSAFHTTRLALPSMRAKQWGRIINIASVHGLVGSKDKSAYVAAKHGLVGFTKVVALELSTTPITCNAICPGFVLTPLVETQIQARAREKSIGYEQAKSDLLQEKQPSLEFVSPEQLSDLAVYLCSNSAAQIRGVAWNIDGGWCAQ